MPNRAPTPSPRRAWLPPLVCALLAAAVHLPALRAGFVWDDLIVQRYQTPYIRTARDLFRPPEGLVEWSGNYFRPVVILSYLAENRLNDAFHGPAGFDPEALGNPARARIPHGATLLFHALAAAAVAVFARRCLAGRPGAEAGAWAAGLVFALHPVHVEAAASVAGRSDSLAALFLLASLLAALRGRDRASLPSLVGGSALFLLALLSKESAAAGLLLLPLCLALVPAPDGEGAGEKRLAWPNFAAPGLFVFAAGAYAVLRFASGTGTGAALAWEPTRLLQAAAFYVGKLLLPWPHTPFVPELPGAAPTAAFLAAGALLAGAAILRWRKGDRLYLFCLLWVAAACLPPLAVVVRDVAKAAAAERYLYLPSVGFALAAGGIASMLSVRAGWGRRAGGFLLALLLAAYAGASYAGARIWRSDIALWTHVTSQGTSARHALGWTNLGIAHLRAGDLDAAERSFVRTFDYSATAPPDLRAIVVNGLGAVSRDRAEASYLRNRREETMRHLAEAEGYFNAAVMTNPAAWGYWSNLASTRLLRVKIGEGLTGRVDRDLLARAGRDIEEGLRVMPGNGELLGLKAEHDALSARLRGR